MSRGLGGAIMASGALLYYAWSHDQASQRNAQLEADLAAANQRNAQLEAENQQLQDRCSQHASDLLEHQQREVKLQSQVEQYELKEQIHSLRQTQDIKSYVHAFDELSSKIVDWSESECVETFVQGLATSAKSFMIAQNPGSLARAMQMAIEWERTVECKSEYDFVLDFTKHNIPETVPKNSEDHPISVPSMKVEAPKEGWPVYFSPNLLANKLERGQGKDNLEQGQGKDKLEQGQGKDKPEQGQGKDPLPPLSERFIKHFNREGRALPVIAVFGQFNKGKTFLINLLAEANLPSDATVHTVGLSVIASKRAIFIDSAGSHSPVFLPSEDKAVKQAMLDQMAVSMMTQHALFNIATVHVAVMTELTLLDQDLILALENRLLNATGGELIIVHNYMQASSEKEICGLIQNHIINLNAIHNENPQGAHVFKITKPRDKVKLTTTHVPLVNNNCTFGAIFNKKQVDYLHEFIRTRNREDVALWDHLYAGIGKTLKEFSENKLEEDTTNPKVVLVDVKDSSNEYDEMHPKAPAVNWEQLDALTRERAPPRNTARPSLLALKPFDYNPAEVRLNPGDTQFGAAQTMSLAFAIIELRHDRVLSNEGLAFVLSLPDLEQGYKLGPESDHWLLVGCLGGIDQEARDALNPNPTVTWKYPFPASSLAPPSTTSTASATVASSTTASAITVTASSQENIVMRSYGSSVSATRPRGKFHHKIPFSEIGSEYDDTRPQSWYHNGVLTIFFPKKRARRANVHSDDNEVDK